MVLSPKPLDWRYGDEAELIRHAATIAGHKACDVASAVGQAAYNDAPTAAGKTGVGHLVEFYMGRRPNPRAEPDIAELGVEIKILPIKRKGASFAVKEPTSLTMIDYRTLINEAWAAAPVQHKLNRILWFPYDHHLTDKRLSSFRKPFLWSPDAGDAATFEQDYEGVRDFVQQGRAHELSESLSLVLAARRKGSRGQMAPQPKSPIPAKSRAWALKVGYTGQVFTKHVLRAETVSLVESLRDVRTLYDVMPYVEGKLRTYEGKTLEAIAKATGAKVVGGKSGPAAFVRSLLGITGRGSIDEFEKLGIRVHTLTVNRATGKLWEAVSFPAMNLREFVEEEWEDAELRQHLDNILFIPLFGETKQDRMKRKLGRAFFWQPDAQTWDRIETEWAMYRKEVREGRAAYAAGAGRRRSGLTPASETECIHVRPHGQDSDDTDIDPKGNVVTKQSFWLNKNFVEAFVDTARERA